MINTTRCFTNWKKKHWENKIKVFLKFWDISKSIKLSIWFRSCKVLIATVFWRGFFWGVFFCECLEQFSEPSLYSEYIKIKIIFLTTVFAYSVTSLVKHLYTVNIKRPLVSDCFSPMFVTLLVKHLYTVQIKSPSLSDCICKRL